RRRARPHEPPGEPSQEERDADLHEGHEERVVVRAGVARRLDVAPDVDPMRETAADELGDEREQAERRSGESPVVTARPLHPAPSVTGRTAAAQGPAEPSQVALWPPTPSPLS